MKRLKTGALAIAALVGLGGAFAFTTHHKVTSNKIFAKLVTRTPLVYHYFNAAPGGGLLCKLADPTEACTFTSTATAAFFNVPANNYVNAYPLTQVSPAIPEITATPTTLIYQ